MSFGYFSSQWIPRFTPFVRLRTGGMTKMRRRMYHFQNSRREHEVETEGERGVLVKNQKRDCPKINSRDLYFNRLLRCV